MADTTTTNYGLTKPEVGASEDTWGTKINTNLDTLDTTVDSIQGKSGAGVLKHTNNTKLATTSTGIDVTGSVTATSVNTGAGTAGRNTFSSGDIRVAAPNDANISLMTVSNTLATIKTDYYGGGSLVPLVLQTGGNTNQLYLSTSGSVGIGASPVSYANYNTLAQSGTTGVTLEQRVGATLTGSLTTDSQVTLNAVTAIPLVFKTTNAERMRIDASGNLLVGTTDSTLYNNTSGSGTMVNSFGRLDITRDDVMAIFNRNTSDGEMINFRKDGSTVGSIGAAAGNLYIVSNDVGLNFAGGGDGIYPATANGAQRDAAIDLGASSHRFKDLYLSGGVNISNGSVATGGDNYVYSYSGGSSGQVRSGIKLEGSTNTLEFYTGQNETMRIDPSGNLLVGGTAQAEATSVTLNQQGYIYAKSSHQQAAFFDRDNSDGEIVTFRKQGTAVGSIGSNSGYMVIGSPAGSDAHLLIGNGLIHPATSTGGTKDNAIDIGGSSNRFKDLYLSGAANVGSEVVLADSGTAKFAIGNSGNDFYIYSNAAGSERMRIDSSGNLLVGETGSNPYNGLTTAHVFKGASAQGGSAPFGIYSSTGTANVPVLNLLSRDTSTDSTNRFMQFYANVTSTTNTAMGGIVGNGASNVQFATISDVREKTNIARISGSLEKINALNPVEFDWIASGEHVNAGFVAQEVETVFPEFVVENMSSEGEEERKGLTGGMTGGIVAHLVKAIQEQQTLIESLTTRIAALEE